MIKISFKELPEEAHKTLQAVKDGPPYPFPKDGIEFKNYEKHLAAKEGNYYQEFTVSTPNMHNRGAKRIIVGKNGEIYYTDDHYETFKELINE